MIKIKFNKLNALPVFTLFMLTMVYGSSAYSDDNNGAALGFSLGETDNDFTAGLNFTTPKFFDNHVAFRYSANIAIYRAIPDNESTYKFMPYHFHKFGLIGYRKQNKNFRLYSEGGIVVVFPNSDMSADTEFGGYGNLGIEYIQNKNAYYTEMGAIGTGAKAEKITGEPFYLNGFTISVGWRHYLK
jgi:hypothetical protein